MKKITSAILTLSLAMLVARAAEAPPQAQLDEHLEPLRKYLGTWRGEFKNSTPEKPVIDVALWERALNGKAIRVVHSINEGMYGGESLIFWDDNKKAIVSYYFTTAGFHTTGTATFTGGKLVNHEIVTGEATGTKEVKSTSEFLPDGTFVSKASYLKNGNWEPGHEIHYKSAPDAKVIFK